MTRLSPLIRPYFWSWREWWHWAVGAVRTSPGLGGGPACQYHSGPSKLGTFATAGSGRFHREEVGKLLMHGVGGNHKRPRKFWGAFAGEGRDAMFNLGSLLKSWNGNLLLGKQRFIGWDCGLRSCSSFSWDGAQVFWFEYNFETRKCFSKKVTTHRRQSPYPTMKGFPVQSVGRGVFQGVLKQA